MTLRQKLDLWLLGRRLRAAYQRVLRAKEAALEYEMQAREAAALARAWIQEAEQAEAEYQEAATAMDRWEQATGKLALTTR
jgi:hypothetical protein